MSTETTERLALPPLPPSARRALPARTPDELAQRAETLHRLFADYEAHPPDEPTGLDEDIMRGIDEARPHRPLFEGLY